MEESVKLQIEKILGVALTPNACAIVLLHGDNSTSIQFIFGEEIKAVKLKGYYPKFKGVIVAIVKPKFKILEK